MSFKGAHFPKDVILYGVFFYVRYGVYYRELEEIMEEMALKGHGKFVLPRKASTNQSSLANSGHPSAVAV